MKITFDEQTLEINDYTIYNINEKMINSIIDSLSLYSGFENNYNINELMNTGRYFNGYLKKLLIILLNLI